jgi:hypothetical protein
VVAILKYSKNICKKMPYIDPKFVNMPFLKECLKIANKNLKKRRKKKKQ